MAHTKKQSREYRQQRIRKKLSGVGDRPRLSVFRSISHFYAQLIDDQQGKTLLSVSTTSKDFTNKKAAGNVQGAKELGKLIAQKALGQKIERVVFDRGGFLYHGRIKAFADGAREGGLQF